MHEDERGDPPRLRERLDKVVDGQGVPPAAQHQQEIARAEAERGCVDCGPEGFDDAQSHAAADQAQSGISQMQSPLERPAGILAAKLVQIDGARSAAALEQRSLGDPVEWPAARGDIGKGRSELEIFARGLIEAAADAREAALARHRGGGVRELQDDAIDPRPPVAGREPPMKSSCRQ